MLPSSNSSKEIDIKFKTTVDTSGADKTSASIEKIKKQEKESQREQQRTSEGMKGIANAAGIMKSAGSALTITFGAMSAAILKSANSYVQQVGMGEKTSRSWLGSVKAIEQANIRIGRVMAEQTVPYMEKAADLVEQAAGFLEKNPDVAKAGVTVVGSLAAIGTVLVSAAGVMKAASALNGIFGAGGGILGSIGLGAAAPYLGIAGLVGAAGVGGYSLLANSQAGKSAGMATGGQVATVAAYGAGKLFGGEQLGLEWAASIGKLTGAIKETGQAASTAGRELDFSSGQIAAYTSYIRQEQQAERQYNIQKQRAVRDYNRQEVIETQDYYKQRQRSMRDYMIQETHAEEDYYRQRAIRSRDFGIQVARDEYDFQKDRRRSLEDHNWRLRKIILEGDATAFWEENRSYNIERSRAEEDYRTQQARNAEDFARELADQEREFQIERERRAQEFEIKMKDEEYDFQLRRRRAKEQFQLQLYDMQVSYNEERLARRQALFDQLRDLQGALERERLMRLTYNKAMLEDLQSAINAAQRGTNLYQTRDSGGYMFPGIYQNATGRAEFALAPDTTSILEKLAGGRLTQDNVLAILARGGAAGSRAMTDNRQFYFNRGFTIEDIKAIKAIFRDEFSRAFV